MNRKSLAAATLASLGLAVLISCPVQAADPVIIKLATIVPRNSVWDLALGDMAADFKKDSAGQVQVHIYAGSVMGDDRDVVRKMKGGVLNAALLGPSGLEAIDPEIAALSIPMMFDSYDEAYAVLDQLRPRFEKHCAEQGFIVLNWADAGFVHFLTTEPVRTPDDLRRLKIFTWQDDSSGVKDLWESAGFTAVALPSTEITTALETGLITAVPISPEPASLMEWNEHARYMTNIKWGILLGATVVKKSTWDSLPPDLQLKLQADATKAGTTLREGSRKTDATAVQAMKDHGLTVVEPDLVAWRQVVEPVWARLRGSMVPADLFDEVKTACAAWRAAHPEGVDAGLATTR